MKKVLLVIFCLVYSFSSSAQTGETDAIKATINGLFDAMRKGDSTELRRAFAPKSILQTIVKRNGVTEVRSESPDSFIKAIGTPHEKVYDERITFDNILLDGNLASVWTSYQFYLGDQFSHCGVNSFQLVKLSEGWKVVHLIDTRRKDNCN